jgi:hypothetical protein
VDELPEGNVICVMEGSIQNPNNVVCIVLFLSELREARDVVRDGWDGSLF